MSRYTGGCWACPMTTCEQAGWEGQIPAEYEEWCYAYDYEADRDGVWNEDDAEPEAEG